jgi:hypothetical protein
MTHLRLIPAIPNVATELASSTLSGHSGHGKTTINSLSHGSRLCRRRRDTGFRERIKGNKQRWAGRYGDLFVDLSQCGLIPFRCFVLKKGGSRYVDR